MNMDQLSSDFSRSDERLVVSKFREALNESTGRGVAGKAKELHYNTLNHDLTPVEKLAGMLWTTSDAFVSAVHGCTMP